jgi:hypothetical protein
MNQTMLERILAFEPLYAEVIPPPAPRLVRQNAVRPGSEDSFLMDSDDETMDLSADLSDLSDSVGYMSDSDETG